MDLYFSEKELNKAKCSLENMKEIKTNYSAKGLSAFETNWIDFLINLEKVWKKSELECRNYLNFQPWQGKYQRERRKDPLLKYLKNARDADQHSLQFITSEKGYSCEIVYPSNGFILKIGESIRVIATSEDPRIEAEPVENRKIIYELPINHLGKKLINPNDPLEIAELGFNYYEEYLRAIRAKFIK